MDCRNLVTKRPLVKSISNGASESVLQSDEQRKKKREYDSVYRARNKDKRMQASRVYGFLNKDKKKEYDRLYHSEHKTKIEEMTREFRLRNKELKVDSNRRYNAENRDKIRESNRHYRIENHFNPGTYLPRDSESRSWKTPELVRDYFEAIAKRLHVSEHTDWYRISRATIGKEGGSSLLDKFGTLGAALQYAYPEIGWDPSKFATKGKKTEQRWLKVCIESLLHGVTIIEEYQHPTLKWENSDRRVELDVWIPQHQIGIEYQGQQHYFSLDNAFGSNGPSGLYWERDLKKQSLCQLHGITLILIPYWWDGDKESLGATLFRARPDVFPVSNANPIASERPAIPSNNESGMETSQRQFDEVLSAAQSMATAKKSKKKKVGMPIELE